MKVEIYSLRYAYSMPSLFGDTVYAETTDALKQVISNDFLQSKELVFVNPKNGRRYIRRYGLMPQGGVAVIDIGKFVDDEFVYATVAINLSRREYDPYVVIVCHRDDFCNVKLISDIVRQAFDWALHDRGLCAKMKLCKEQLDWERDFVWSYIYGMEDRRFNPMNQFGFELLKKDVELAPSVSNLRKTDVFREYICHKDKDLVVRLIREAVRNLKGAKNIARVIRFLQDKKVITRPSFLAFISEFKELEGKISVSRFNYYTNPINRPYDNDPQYDGLFETFESLITT